MIMKKIISSVLVILLAVLVWYLFIKKYDYQFKTTAKYGPGAIAYELSEWKNLDPSSSANAIKVIGKESYNSLTQQVRLDDEENLEFKWEFEKLNDSITAINLNILSPQNQLANRLEIINPFKKSIYIDTLKQSVLSFKRQLAEHQKLYKIKPLDSLVSSPEMECVCSSSKNIPLTGKAAEMMETISLLENFILKNKIDLNGYPFLKVTQWDRDKDLIDFDFCFPVKEATTLVAPPNLNLKKFQAKKAVKLIFNGNYRLSHVSWFDLLYLANEQGLEPESWPMEVYHNNPKINMDELNWVAEIYLPVKD